MFTILSHLLQLLLNLPAVAAVSRVAPRDHATLSEERRLRWPNAFAERVPSGGATEFEESRSHRRGLGVTDPQDKHLLVRFNVWVFFFLLRVFQQGALFMSHLKIPEKFDQIGYLLDWNS